MKKQYLIGLLGLTAISIPMGTSLLNFNNYSPTVLVEKNIDDLATGITFDKETTAFVTSTNDDIVNEGDELDAIVISASYNVEDRVGLEKIDKDNDQLHFYYNDSNEDKEKSVSLTYTKFLAGAGRYGTAEYPGYVGNDKSGTFNILIDSTDDGITVDPDGSFSLWEYAIKDNAPFSITSDVTKSSNSTSYETVLGEVPIELGFKKSILNSVEVKDTSSNSATIEYGATLGREITGENAIVESAILYENGEPFAVQENSSEGIIEVYNLTPGTSYDNVEVQVQFSNAKEPQTKTIDNLKTKSAPDTSKVTVMETTDINETEATINYNIELAEGDKFVSAKLYENSEATEILGTQKPSKVKGNKKTILVSDLTEDKNYVNAELRVTFEDAGEVIAPIKDLITDPIPTKSIVKNASAINLTDTTATIKYDIELAEDDEFVSAKLYENNKATEILGKQTASEIKNNKGTIEVYNLTPDTNYEKAELRVTFEDAGEVKTSVDNLHTIPTSNNLGAGAIIGIIIGVLLLVGIIAWIGYILYKKYKAKKLSMETKVQVKVALEKQEEENTESKEENDKK